MTTQTDTYYRGYRLSDNALGHGHVHIYCQADFLGTAPHMDAAKAIVDDYLVADDGR
jgi:hypothetical protein